MRAELARHFDVVVVIWVLALAVAFCIVLLSHSQLGHNPWSLGAGQNWPAPTPQWWAP